MSLDSSPTWKRRRLIAVSPMESELAQAKIAAAREKYGREIRVFETSVASVTQGNGSNIEVTDDFYEFTAEDYYRILATKKEDKYLKTKKIRDSEIAAQRARITKTVIRVRFPDNHTLEVSFHPSETMQCLVDFLNKVVARQELPFYLYTTPPKKILKDMAQDFFSAGFVPGAIVYFAHNLPKGDDDAPYTGPFLQEDVMSLQGLEFIVQEKQPADQPEPEPAASSSSYAPAPKKTEKKMNKPKWLKM